MNYRDVLFYKYLHGSGGSQPAWDGATFPSYANGTEQILPENTADPDSSPFLGDIRYPDGTRRNNYFTYRESPNTVDGQAKITRIKGNTLVWNQYFPLTSGNNSRNGVTLQGQGDGSFHLWGTWATGYTGDMNMYADARSFSFIAGHKYLIYSSSKYVGIYYYRSGQTSTNTGIVSEASPIKIYTATESSLFNQSYQFAAELRSVSSALAIDETVYFMLIDLTQMGLDTLSLAEVQQWFSNYYPLPYYAYTQGKLLPFKGESLKTVGKNFYQQVTWYRNNSNSVDVKDNNNNARIKSDVFSLKKGTYVVSGYPSGTNPIALRCYDVNYNLVESPSFTNDVVELTEGAIEYGSMLFGGSGFTSDTNTLFYNANIQLESGSTATSYEPYTSSTINLPTLNYFPTGMKSAGSVFDEITESKAITRVGSVDLGTIDWTAFPTTTSNVYRMRSTNLASIIKPSPNDNTKANIVCAIYPTRTSGDSYANPDTNGISIGTTGNIFVNDGNYNTSSSASAFKTAMSGVYLYYELATPTEEPISSQTQLQNQALSTILGKTVSVDSPEEPLNILLKGE